MYLKQFNVEYPILTDLQYERYVGLVPNCTWFPSERTRDSTIHVTNPQ